MKAPVQFGPYQLLERISVGGMAEVYKAKEFGADGFERLVAIKRILPHVAEDEEFIAMFKDEAKIAVQLSHGNIAQIYNLDTHEDSFYIALEYVAGRDLRAIFQRCQQQGRPMPIEQACFIIMKVCEGLDYAHNKKDSYGRELNIVHRDVSPPNILVSYEGEVKLIDFGVAKAAGRASKTQAGILKGKFGYMSPEQVRGMPLDRRSDVFSVGVVLWEILTGQRLFQGDTDFATLEMVRKVEVPGPRTINPAIPEDLEQIVFKALAREPEQRYQSAIELHDELQAFMFRHGLFYSRKALAAWMRQQYAKEIELEKQKANQTRGGGPSGAGARRKTMMMSPGARPPPPPPGGKPPPSAAGAGGPPGPPPGGGRQPPKPKPSAKPKPSSVPTQAHRPVSAAPPPSKPPRPGRGARRTMMMSPGRAPVPPPGAKPAPPSAEPGARRAPRPAPKAAPKPAPKASAPSGKGRGGEFDWDDDELETRLFDGEVGQGLEETNRASEMQAARLATPVVQPAGPPPSAAEARAPAAAGPPPSTAEGGTPSTGGRLPPPPARSTAPTRPPPAQPDESPRKSRTGLIVGAAVAVLLLVVGTVTGVVLMRSRGDTAASAGVGSLTVNVTPSDATVMVDGKPVPGTSPFLVADLSAGTHKIVVRKPGFLPFEKEVEVRAGAPLVVPVELPLETVNLKLDVQPAEAKVALLAGDRRTEIGKAGDVYALKREPGVSYQVEVSAEGYETQTVPLVLGKSASQTVSVSLTKAAGGASAPSTSKKPDRAVAAATSPRRPKKRSPKKPRRPAAGSGTGMLGVATKPGTPPASVSVDGRGIGKTPRPPKKVSAGTHTVKCTWSDGKSFVKRVKVPKGGRVIVRCQK